MSADLSGADLVTVAHTVAGVQSKTACQAEIKKPEDLRGKRIAVSGFGSLGDFLERYNLKKYGIDPVRESSCFPSATNRTGFKLYSQARSIAADLSHPADIQAERKGYRFSGTPNRKLPTFNVDRHQA